MRNYFGENNIMNKPILSIATFSLLLPFSITVHSENGITSPPRVTAYTKDFSLKVVKEPLLKVDLPVEDIIEIPLEDIINPKVGGALATGGTVVDAVDLPVGSMNIATSSSSCHARISTENNFSLMGKEKRKKLVEYNILYSTESGKGSKTFGRSYPEKQRVDCSLATLDMRVVRSFSNTPEDSYGDVIRVAIEAES